MSFARAQLRRIVAALLVLAAIGLAAAGGAEARPPQAYIVIDAESGRTLLDRDGDLAVHPASLTKMMTLYLLFDALDSGRLKLDSPIRFSRKAARQPPSKLGTPAGGAITVRTAILALAVKSGNDVAVAVAERLAGSEQKFALQMNEKARALGMSRTNFVNASGLHDRDQVSTPRDLARLARGVLYKHKTYFDRFSASSFRYAGRTYRTHNRFVKNYPGADGIKTGYVNASGFNLAGSAVRNGRRLIGVIIGGRSASERDKDLAGLMDEGFRVASGLGKPRFAGIAPVAVDWRSGLPAMPPRRPGTRPAAPALAFVTPPRRPEDAQTIAALVSVVASADDSFIEPVTAEGDADPVVAAIGGDYAAQVGAVTSKRAAANLARTRLQALGGAIAGGEPTVKELRLKSGRRLYRARIGGLSGEQARAVCDRLKRDGRDCLVVATSSG